jgi:hypothetical protein
MFDGSNVKINCIIILEKIALSYPFLVSIAFTSSVIFFLSPGPYCRVWLINLQFLAIPLTTYSGRGESYQK